MGPCLRERPDTQARHRLLDWRKWCRKQSPDRVSRCRRFWDPVERSCHSHSDEASPGLEL